MSDRGELCRSIHIIMGSQVLFQSFARYEGQRQWIIEEILNSMANTSDSVSGHPKFK